MIIVPEITAEVFKIMELEKAHIIIYRVEGCKISENFETGD